MKAVRIVHTPEHVQQHEGVSGQHIKLWGGRLYYLISLSSSFGDGALRVMIRDREPWNVRKLNPSEVYNELEWGDCCAHDTGDESDKRLMVLWTAEECDRIEADEKGVKLLGSYQRNGRTFRAVTVLAKLPSGKSLKAYPPTEGAYAGRFGVTLIRNESGKLVVYREMK
jgi:hypothetical protein